MLKVVWRWRPVTRITLGWVVVDRSFTPRAHSIGNTFTFGVVDRSRVRTSLRTFFFFRNACACLKTHISLVRPKMKRRGYGSAYRRMYTVPMPQRSRRSEARGGGCYKDYTLGWDIDRFFYPYSSVTVGNTFTAPIRVLGLPRLDVTCWRAHAVL